MKRESRNSGQHSARSRTADVTEKDQMGGDDRRLLLSWTKKKLSLLCIQREMTVWRACPYTGSRVSESGGDLWWSFLW